MVDGFEERTGTRARRATRIRWHLFHVLLVSIVPIGLFAAGLLYLHWQAQEAERERSQIESVRLLAAAVDNALDSTVERLSIFARLWTSSPASDAVIYAQAREALRTNADWLTILAFRADGTGVFRSDRPFGTDVPDMPFVDLWRPAITERRVVVSDVFTEPVDGTKVVAVGVPVVRGDTVTHLLIADLDLRWFDRLLTRQGLPEGGVAGLFDRRSKFVARSTEGEARRGTDPTGELVEDMKARPEGIARYTNLNGTAVYTAWTGTRHGWGVGFATPSAPVENALWSHLVVFVCLWVAMVVVGIVYALSKGRLIAASLYSLEGQARHLATGRRIAGLPVSRVEEVDRALLALQTASGLLQDAIRERDRSLQTEREARATAEAGSRAKDEFLAMLGHELRNPLAAISSAVSIVRNPRRTREQLDFAAGVIARQSQHLKRLLDDLLDVGRAMTGKILLERRPLDLAASVRHVVETLQAAGRLADRDLQLEAASPVWVGGDHTRIEQIATNLLVNAARYTAPGGHIRVRVGQEAGQAFLEVSDDGRGIAPEHLARVFELFFQADSTVDRGSGGLGIGLTLVQRLARLHGGEVTVDSAGRGRGATFRVRLPAITAPEPVPEAPAATHQGRGQTVLVVEDNTDERESLRLALELQGHRVLQAADGPGGIDLMRRHRPPVAVVDIGLPGMDGYQLAAVARGELGRGIVLVALTGYGTAGDERSAMEAGFDRHLTKPVDLAELLQALELAGRSPRAAT